MAQVTYPARALLLRDGPTALFVSTDAQALGVLSTCSERDLRVPADVALVSFDGSDAARFGVPALTAVTQPVGQLARRAVSHLLEVVRVPGTAQPPYGTVSTSRL